MISSHNLYLNSPLKLNTFRIAHSEAFLEIWLCKCHMHIDIIDNRNTGNDVKNLLLFIVGSYICCRL